jgi:hypothetical protein
MTATNPDTNSQGAPPATAAGPPPPPKPAEPKPAAAIVHTTSDASAINAFGSDANFAHAQRMAKLLSSSTMVPEQYRTIYDGGKLVQDGIPNCIIALELAARIGASVFMVMQHLYIVHGKPGWSSAFLIATVNASRRFTPLRFRWEGTRGQDDFGCRCVARDRETNEECKGALVDWKMVKAEGWLSKKGSKWATMPEQMFIYRAASFWTRAYAPELSLGIQTTEEVIDTVGELVGMGPAAISGPPSVAANGPTTVADVEALLEKQAKAPVDAPPAGPQTIPQEGQPVTLNWPPCATCGKAIGAQDEPVRVGPKEWRHSACPPVADGNKEWGIGAEGEK